MVGLQASLPAKLGHAFELQQSLEGVIEWIVGFGLNFVATRTAELFGRLFRATTNRSSQRWRPVDFTGESLQMFAQMMPYTGA